MWRVIKGLVQDLRVLVVKGAAFAMVHIGDHNVAIGFCEVGKLFEEEQIGRSSRFLIIESDKINARIGLRKYLVMMVS